MYGIIFIDTQRDKFYINVDTTAYPSGDYVSDPILKEEVRAYAKSHPSKVIYEHPLEKKMGLQMEMEELESYLRSTDYMAIKCGERGLSMASEYPVEYAERQRARDRINEINALMKYYR